MQTRQFPWEYQMDAKDCGPACIKMIAKYYGKYYSLQYLRDLCGITREGVSFWILAMLPKNRVKNCSCKGDYGESDQQDSTAMYHTLGPAPLHCCV